jgi:MFS family permease
MIAVAETLMGPAFPFILKEFAVPFGLLGLLASIWSLGYVLSFAGGILSDRYGELLLVSTSLATTGSTVALVSVASTYQVLIGLFLLGGIGAGFADASMNPLISKLYPDRSGFALNLLHLFYSLGAFIGPVMAGILIAKYGSWRLPYQVTSLIFLPLIVVAIGVFRLKRPNGQELSIDRGRLSIEETLKRGKALVLAGFFYFGAEYGAIAWLPAFLMFVRRFPTELASFALALFWAGQVGGRLLLGSVTDRLGFRKVVIICSTAGAFLVLGGALVESQYGIMVLWSLAGFVSGPILPAIFALTNSLFESQKGFATGVINSVGYLGGVFSPWFIGTFAQRYSLNVSVFYLAFSTLAVGLSVLNIRGSCTRWRKVEDRLRPLGSNFSELVR